MRPQQGTTKTTARVKKCLYGGTLQTPSIVLLLGMEPEPTLKEKLLAWRAEKSRILSSTQLTESSCWLRSATRTTPRTCETRNPKSRGRPTPKSLQPEKPRNRLVIIAITAIKTTIIAIPRKPQTQAFDPVRTRPRSFESHPTGTAPCSIPPDLCRELENGKFCRGPRDSCFPSSIASGATANKLNQQLRKNATNCTKQTAPQFLVRCGLQDLTLCWHEKYCMGMRSSCWRLRM